MLSRPQRRRVGRLEVRVRSDNIVNPIIIATGVRDFAVALTEPDLAAPNDCAVYAHGVNRPEL